MPNLAAWFNRCMENPAFVRHLGHIKSCEKAFKAWDGKVVAAPTPAAAAPKKEEKKAAADDDMDLFGDDNEEDAEAAKAVAEKAKAA